MGLISISELQQGEKGKLGIWELSETCNALLEDYSFSVKEKLEYEKITSKKRKCEFLAVRKLLTEMMQHKQELYYLPSGKPFLNEKLHISISHSAELAVILLTAKRAGIDVESLQRNTSKIATRFLSENELQAISNTPNPDYTRLLYWCAKEAMFKCTSLRGIDFKSQIRINPFQPYTESGHFTGYLLNNNEITEFAFTYFIINSNAIVYCMEKAKLNST
jgi:phosphopantetheinyl transferase